MLPTTPKEGELAPQHYTRGSPWPFARASPPRIQWRKTRSPARPKPLPSLFLRNFVEQHETPARHPGSPDVQTPENVWTNTSSSPGAWLSAPRNPSPPGNPSPVPTEPCLPVVHVAPEDDLWSVLPRYHSSGSSVSSRSSLRSTASCSSPFVSGPLFDDAADLVPSKGPSGDAVDGYAEPDADADAKDDTDGDAEKNHYPHAVTHADVKYAVVGTLGEGAFGRVFLAITSRTELVALKVIHKRRLYREYDAKESLINERNCMAMATDDGLNCWMGIRAAWEDEENAFFAMVRRVRLSLLMRCAHLPCRTFAKGP